MLQVFLHRFSTLSAVEITSALVSRYMWWRMIMRRLWYRDTYPVFCPGFQKDRVLSEKGHFSAVNWRKRAWHNKRCTAQFTLCVGNKKGNTELKAMCDWYLKKKKKKKFSIAILGSRYDTRIAGPSIAMHRCIDTTLIYMWLSLVFMMISTSLDVHIHFPVTLFSYDSM